ncbi:amidophosphoribosyltransferase [Neocallimastix lanati (nom. inval.)]|uniref:Amidophosphoribosyltransferase n=1 Tax=Neocallimastix californiae TaxID=1754190 RepID=A0A1Y2AHW6_9FUNG|nr:amidophosphoribosyltransferase [Neocallimastix sp. JGI-2020a]ORY22198.1 amidophosphoribosyltransferase [Neocallimastix californiae]|eukprot:ORY22198.1 amidophosphoribosyltransferase [Neocallimastix californiae]
MCGISGILLADTSKNCSVEIYESLNVLQHRGQDAAGIVTCNKKGRLYQCKANGMVKDVFSQKSLMNLIGPMGVGHVRYPTAGTSSNSEAQPFYVNSPYGLNGNLTNAHELAKFLDEEAHRHINTDSDTELMLNIFADNLQQTGKFRVNEEDTFHAIKGIYQQCRGGYACIAMISGFGLIAFRDPNGIRPLIYGTRETPNGTDYMIASESVALDTLDFKQFVDVKPGEAVIITENGMSKRQLVTGAEFTPCIFEYVYFARPDSIIDGISVYKSRLAMGEALADSVVRKLGAKMDVDVVIPVPDTSRVAALQVSYKLRILYREGFIKNRYVGRTFIMPGQSERKKSVRRKLNAMDLEFQGKNVLIVDDSIVRGTTSREIIQMAREAGAKKVYFASCSPPIRFPNVYGIDMPTSKELIAYNRTEEEIAKELGADCVIYEELDDLIESCRKFNRDIKSFDTSVFNGKYVTGDVTKEYLEMLDRTRNDKAKVKEDIKAEVIGLYNKYGESS